MIKVIFPPRPLKCVCPHCEATIEYEYTDLKNMVDSYRYIDCPVCKSIIKHKEYQDA